jgi:hypothetical protein
MLSRLHGRTQITSRHNISQDEKKITKYPLIVLKINSFVFEAVICILVLFTSKLKMCGCLQQSLKCPFKIVAFSKIAFSISLYNFGFKSYIDSDFEHIRIASTLMKVLFCCTDSCDRFSFRHGNTFCSNFDEGTVLFL